MRTPTWLAVAASAVLTLGLSAPSHAATSQTVPHPDRGPGRAGNNVTVLDKVTLDEGYDIASDKNGTAYLGFIGDVGDGSLRQVYLCVLPRHATSCQGGLKKTDALGDSTAKGLHVVVSAAGGVTLVWLYDGINSGTDPNGSFLASSSYVQGALQPAATHAAAVSHSELLDVQADHHGTIWAITDPPLGITGNQPIAVYDGLDATPKIVSPGIRDLDARIAFHGNTAVIAAVKAPDISDPVKYATETGTTWSAFKSLAHTWNLGQAYDIADTSRGMRLIASTDDASYHPVISQLSGTTFGKPALTGDTNACAPSAHDLQTDASGRLADVSPVCSKLRLTDLPQTTKAAYVDIPSGGTLAGGDAQLTTLPNGSGWIAYSIESSTGEKLIALPIQLPALTKAAVRHGTPGYVSVRGPVSCLPATTAQSVVGAKANPPWHLVSKSLTLDGKAHGASTVNGASLTSGSTHTLVGHATFHKAKKGKQPAATKSLSVSLSFKVC